jgi:hypothetical protein
VLSVFELSEALLSEDLLSVELPPQPVNIIAIEQTRTAAKTNAKTFFINIHLLFFISNYKYNRVAGKNQDYIENYAKNFL